MTFFLQAPDVESNYLPDWSGVGIPVNQVLR